MTDAAPPMLPANVRPDTAYGVGCRYFGFPWASHRISARDWRSWAWWHLAKTDCDTLAVAARRVLDAGGIGRGGRALFLKNSDD